MLKKLKQKLVSKLLKGLGLGCESAEELRKRGVIVGERLNNYGVIDNGHGFLVTIGDDVTISSARILTHDGSTKIWTGYSKVGEVKIGSRVFIGAGAVILPNVSIGDDVIIGAGAIVTHDIPSNSVAVGNPAKVISSLEDYIEKHKKAMETNPVWHTYWKEKNEDEKIEMRNKLTDGIWGYDI
jgi:maltose O-acetyltransferase